MLPVRSTLLRESLHALLLIFQRKHGVEDAALEAQALLQVELIGGVDCLLSHGDRGAGEGGDLLADLQRSRQQLE